MAIFTDGRRWGPRRQLAPERGPAPTILIVPGLGGSGAGHWQTIWQERHPAYRRVEQASWDAPRRAAWTVRLEAAVRAAPGRVVLVAHSLGCALVAHWAQRGSVERVASALLVAPADVERADRPPALKGFAPLPAGPLPFPTWLVASADDPYLPAARARTLAAAWRARLLEIGHAGHVNVASGHGPWPEGEALLEELARAATLRSAG